MRIRASESFRQAARKEIMRLRVTEGMKRFFEKGLGTQDPHFFGRCMSHNFGKKFTNKERFCAWLHKRVQGHWPSED